MAKTSILSQLRIVIPDLVDINGNFRTIPIGLTAQRKLSVERIRFLNNFIDFVLHTDATTDETKLYVLDKYITIKGVNEKINSEIVSRSGKIKFLTTQSRIQADKNKLTAHFGEHLFEDIFSKNKDISRYESTLAELFFKSSKNEYLRNNLMLKFKCDKLNNELTDDEFNDFVNTIKPYIAEHVRFIEENIDKRYVGYFNYITSMPSLNNIDRNRLKVLKEMLGDSEETDNE